MFVKHDVSSASESKILHDCNDFFKKIIQEVKIHIQKMGAVKHKWGKFYY